MSNSHLELIVEKNYFFHTFLLIELTRNKLNDFKMQFFLMYFLEKNI